MIENYSITTCLFCNQSLLFSSEFVPGKLYCPNCVYNIFSTYDIPEKCSRFKLYYCDSNDELNLTGYAIKLPLNESLIEIISSKSFYSSSINGNTKPWLEIRNPSEDPLTATFLMLKENFYLPYQHDLNYFINKIKLLLTFS